MAKFPRWIYRQSAALPYRLRDDALEVLVITSRKGKRWVLPKGIVEPGMTAAASAAKEAREEAGVEGWILQQGIGTYERKKWGGICEVEVFPMEVTSEQRQWPESAIRRREWVTLDEAQKRLGEETLRQILCRLPAAIERGGERTLGAEAVGKRQRVIYLFRHAKSSWDDTLLADFDRPLARRGRRASKIMGRYMRVADLRPEAILCSSAVRTRETLQRVLPTLDWAGPIRYEKALYHAGAGALMDRLRGLSDKHNSTMIIGHNPGLQALAVRLAFTGDAEAMARLTAKFPTAGLATLIVKRDRWRDLAPDTCELHSFVVPRDLA